MRGQMYTMRTSSQLLTCLKSFSHRKSMKMCDLSDVIKLLAGGASCSAPGCLGLAYGIPEVPQVAGYDTELCIFLVNCSLVLCSQR